MPIKPETKKKIREKLKEKILESEVKSDIFSDKFKKIEDQVNKALANRQTDTALYDLTI
jgi:molybdopterin biosynthesis enzyme MoaB